MAFVVNFAKTGSPGSRSFPGVSRYSKTITWPKFESDSRKHLMLGPDPELGSHYRTDKVAVWNKLIPDLIETNNLTLSPGSGPGHSVYSPGPGREDGGSGP